MMKRFLSLFLAVMLLITACAAFAEDADSETGGKGTVTLIDDFETTAELEELLHPIEPGLPGGADKADPELAQSALDASMDADLFVIGADGRTTVDDTKVWPYCTIALLDVHAECGCSWTGSGFLVGGNGLLLTAAHCLVCDEHSQWADSITFYFGYKSTYDFLYAYTGRWDAYAGNIFSNKQYTTAKDFAVVKISSEVPETCGWMGAYWGDDDRTMNSYYVNVAGYRYGKLRYDSGYMSVQDADHVTFLMDEESGNSGGPIYTQDGYAVGIIIAESWDKNGDPIYNIGYRLTNEVFNLAKEYGLE